MAKDHHPGKNPATDQRSMKDKEIGRKVYACNYCKKHFYSSQALGGHQNAHKNERAIDKIRTALDFRHHPYSYPYSFIWTDAGACNSSVVVGPSNTVSSRAKFFDFGLWQPCKPNPPPANHTCCLSGLCGRNILITKSSSHREVVPFLPFCNNNSSPLEDSHHHPDGFNYIGSTNIDNDLRFSSKGMTRADLSLESSRVQSGRSEANTDAAAVISILSDEDASYVRGGISSGINLGVGLRLEESDEDNEEESDHDLTLKL